MSDRPKELSQFVSPDSLRQYLRMMKRFYELHTPKNKGSEDSNGVHYAGTIENFGSELLFETHQLQSKQPPIGYLNISDAIKQYFNVQYSDFISVFEQQNMLCCVLKENVLIKGYRYELRFRNVNPMYVYRSESTSDPDVRRDFFFHSTDEPILTITSPNGDVNTIFLSVSDQTGNDTSYLFPVNQATRDLLDLTDAELEDPSHVYTFTIQLHEHPLVNVPFVWFCVDDFKTYEPIQFITNSDQDQFNRPLLTSGRDGHYHFKLYPLVQGLDNLPFYFQSDLPTYLHVFGDLTNSTNYNYTCKLSKIRYVQYNPQGVGGVWYVHDITWNDTVKIHLSRDAHWNFKTPQSDDWEAQLYEFYPQDYQLGISKFAWCDISQFNDNYQPNVFDRDALLAAFEVEIDDRYSISDVEKLMIHTVSGIHVNDGCEQSQNGVDKIHGVPHHLGQFDGLPRYFADWLTRETHRASVSLYTIRDRVDKSDSLQFQTAGLLIDSGVPQTDMNTILDGLSLTIRYDHDGIFITNGESESSNNWLSNTVYVDANTVASTVMEYISNPKFIYHMNGMFSLGMSGLDPEMEYGRVYVVSNDGIVYDNNDLSLHPKEARCICRICDIPTSYIQLTHIPGKAPTFALDPSYVRQYASFKEGDRNLLWNYRNSHIVTKIDQRGIVQFLFADTADLDVIFPISYLELHYGQMTNLNASLNMSDPNHATEYEFQIANGGSDYEVNSRFTTIIGGIAFDGTVTSIDDGVVTGISFDVKTDRYVNAGNILSQNMICKTTTIGGTGNGLQLRLIVSNETWNSLQMQLDGVLDDLYCFKYDELDHIWIWKFNGSTWVPQDQITGEASTNNRYDVKPTDHTRAWDVSSIVNYPWNRRNWTGVYLYNMLNQHDGRFQPFEYLDTVSIEYADGMIGYDYSESLYTINNDDVTINTRVHPTDWKLLPFNHALNAYVADTTCNMLHVDFTQPQPTVSIYDVYLDQKQSTTSIMDQVYEVTNITPITFKTFMDSSMIQNGILQRDVDQYTYANDGTRQRALEESFRSKTEQELYEIIESQFGDDAEPIISRTTDFRYTFDMLVDYLCERTYPTPIYQHTDIESLRKQGEQVLNGNDPVGIQPTGGYVPIRDTYDTRVTINHSSHQTTPTYVFQIDNFVGSLDGFHMYDEMGNDISEYTILVIDHTLYTYRVASHAWIRIQTST